MARQRNRLSDGMRLAVSLMEWHGASIGGILPAAWRQLTHDIT